MNIQADKNNKLLRNIIFILIVFILGIFAINIYSMYRLKNTTIENHLAIAGTHARGFEGYFSEQISLIDLLCTTVLLIDPELKDPLKKEQINVFFNTYLFHSPLLRSISLVNSQNEIIMSTDSNNIGTLVDFSKFHQQDIAIHGQAIGMPTQGHDLYNSKEAITNRTIINPNEEYFIPISYTLITANNVFHLVITLNPDYMLYKIKHIIQLQNGSLSILRKDGLMLLSTDPAEDIGRMTNDYPITSLSIEKTLARQTDTDLIAYKSTEFYPFIVMAKLGKQQALMHWVNECKMLIAMLTPMLIGLVVLGILYWQRQNQLIQQQIKNITLEEQAQFFQIEARYDPLTQLCNRTYLYEQLVLQMSEANRYGYKLAIAFIDLDGFKQINDTYGHNAGDILLATLAKRFAHNLRHGDILARIGGDEFVAVCKHIIQINEIEPIANRLLTAAAEPVTFEGNTLRVSASIGFAMYNRIPIAAEDIVDLADIAMYKAKQAGKNQWRLYTEPTPSYSRHPADL